MVLLIVIVVILLIIGFVIYKSKVVKISSVSLVSGGVKSGKSTFAVYLALREFKKAVFNYRIKKFIAFLFHKNKPEKPLLYSNIPLSVPYVPITQDLLMRRERLSYGSVCYIGECSLVSNSMNYKNDLINEQILLFNKLFGHETKGGHLIYDTQCINDCHYGIKRSLSEYYYVHHMVKWIPFFLVAYVNEYRYSDDSSTLDNNTDIVDNLKFVIIPKSVWKKFDCYCYSIFTDNLYVLDKQVTTKSLKANDIVSFNKYSKLYGGKDKDNDEKKC